MHRAIEITEVFQMILEGLEDEDVARIARTCRLFFLPAVAQLWRTVHTFSFLHLFDNVLHGKHPERLQYRAGPLSTETRLARFQTYTSLIHSLDFEHYDVQRVDEVVAALRQLRSIDSSLPVLPRLRNLKYMAVRASDLDAAHFLFRHSLEQIDIDQHRFEAWEAPLGVLLEKLPTMAPRVRKLFLHVVLPHNSVHSRTIVKLLQGLNALENLKIDAIALAPSVVEALAAHPSLKELCIACRWGRPLKVVPVFPSMPRNSFRFLRRLKLLDNHHVASNLIQALPMAGDLAELYVRTMDIMKMADIMTLVPTIQSNCQQLQKLELDLHDHGGMSEEPLPWNIFAPLLRCGRIVDFRLNCHSSKRDFSLDLRDSHLESVAKAWPHLVCLQLSWWSVGQQGRLVDESALTLAALNSLAAHCPTLGFVKISRISTSPDIPIPLLSRNRTAAVQLDLGTSLFAHAGELAAYLHALWPRLEIINTSASYDEHLRWEPVQRAIIAIQCHCRLQRRLAMVGLPSEL